MVYAAYLIKFARHGEVSAGDKDRIYLSQASESAFPPIWEGISSGASTGALLSILKPMYRHEYRRKVLRGLGIGAGVGLGAGLLANYVIGTGSAPGQAAILRNALKDGGSFERKEILRKLLDNATARADLPRSAVETADSAVSIPIGGTVLGSALEELMTRPGKYKIEELPKHELPTSRALAIRNPEISQLSGKGQAIPYGELKVKGVDPISFYSENPNAVILSNIERVGGKNMVQPRRFTQLAPPPWFSRMWKHLRPGHIGAGLTGIIALLSYYDIKSKIESGRRVRDSLERARTDPSSQIHDLGVRLGAMRGRA